MLEVISERIHIMTLKVVMQNIAIFTHLADVIIHLKSCFWQSLGQVQKLSLLLALLWSPRAHEENIWLFKPPNPQLFSAASH